jgi:hypothetical protein
MAGGDKFIIVILILVIIYLVYPVQFKTTTNSIFSTLKLPEPFKNIQFSNSTINESQETFSRGENITGDSS